MQARRVFTLTSLAMLAFAGNSLLCRAALKQTSIDAASFTSIRLVAGAISLWLLARMRKDQAGKGNWLSALALFAYAAGFSYAYISLPAATGALLLFGAVQTTMIGHGLRTGERFGKGQLIGLMLALSGLVMLLLPGLAAPSIHGSIFMLCAGIAWGIYSLRGKGAGDPVKVTAGNFIRAVPVTMILSLSMTRELSIDFMGVVYAIASGALASGVGYAIWYSALPHLSATKAATVQLSVPVLATLGGMALLGEDITLRIILASIAILGGIALVIYEKKKS